MSTDWKLKQKNYIDDLEDFQIDLLQHYINFGNELLTSYITNKLVWKDFYIKLDKGEMYFYNHILYNLNYFIKSKIIKIPSEIKDEFSLKNLKKFVNYFSKDDYGKIIDKIIKDIDRIIKNAPVNDQQMILYRGTRDPYFIVPGTNEYISKTIVSTTLNINQARQFMDETTECCLKIISVPPNIHMLYIDSLAEEEDLGGEEEVLLQSNTHFIKEYEDFGKVYHMKIV
jgi:hypothetical protein